MDRVILCSRRPPSYPATLPAYPRPCARRSAAARASSMSVEFVMRAILPSECPYRSIRSPNAGGGRGSGWPRHHPYFPLSRPDPRPEIVHGRCCFGLNPTARGRCSGVTQRRRARDVVLAISRGPCKQPRSESDSRGPRAGVQSGLSQPPKRARPGREADRDRRPVLHPRTSGYVAGARHQISYFSFGLAGFKSRSHGCSATRATKGHCPSRVGCAA